MHNPNLSEVTGNPSSLSLLRQALRGVRQPSNIGHFSEEAIQEHASGHVGHSGQGCPCRLPKE